MTGGSVRYRFWSAWGLSSAEITRAVTFIGVTFGLGMVTVSGAAILLEPAEAATVLHLPTTSLLLVAALLLGVTLVYLAASVRRGGTTIALPGVEIAVPGWRLAVGQVAVPFADWGLAAAVLYVLFDGHAMPAFLPFLAVFILAQFAGLISNVPGGLGVFESVMLVFLRPFVAPDVIIGTLLAYRAVYYLTPFALGVSAVIGYEAWQQRVQVRRVLARAMTWTSLVLPMALATATFVAGAILLVSGATPSVSSRVVLLDRVLPLGMIEMSHFVASLVGSALIILAWSLQRRLDAAYGITVVLLGAGIVTSLLKGLDWEEASALAVVLALLLPSRSAFYRKAALFSEQLEPGWIVAVLSVVGASLWLGVFSYRHVGYRADLWWEFTRHGDASRFLRASVGALGGLLLFSLTRLLRHAPSEPELPDADALRRAEAVVRSSPDTMANLALLGDKALLFSPSGASLLMYAVEGRSWVALGDPIATPEERSDLAWAFRVLVDRHGGWPVFYQVTAEALPVYIDLGLTLLKMGEEAVVPLAGFSLDGGERKGLRRTHRDLGKQGVSFEIVPVESVAEHLPALRAISDEWLEGKSTREKGFSLGRFDEAYLLHFPIGLVRHQGRIVAFSNIWQGPPGTELSVDLMRHTEAAPPGVMEYLFIEMMLWGRANGYRSFSLGMAPMAGFQDRALAPFWGRAGAYLFRHGEHFYNFQGLRQYKEKFHPEWRPRYLASPGGLALPRILTNVASLISGGIRGLVLK